MEATHKGIPRRLCCGCDRVRSTYFFQMSPPDFPTRDGRFYQCVDCDDGVRYTPRVTNFGRKLERVE